MSSNYTFCGFDMQDANSKAGKATTGLNLNSVSVQYMLSTNPGLAQQVYLGIAPSYYGSFPSQQQSVGTMQELPTVDTERTPMNPMDLVKQSSQIPTVQFGGAMNPSAMYRDAYQPTAFAPNQTMGMMNPYMGYGYYGVPYNYNPANPAIGIMPNAYNNAVIEWNDYQRAQGFRANPPLDTDYNEDGLLSGFHQGFDPHAALAPKEDQEYDVTLGGKQGISQFIHEQTLNAKAAEWGWQPGQLIDRREILMFPGVQENHRFNPRPSTQPVLNYAGVEQQMQTNNNNLGPRPANSLPVSNMVATNPFMAGVRTLGQNGPMWNPTAPVPTPYMQARYNYAIANGFQSVQEMDNNDFRVLKRACRAAHADMPEEEFQQYFEDHWCKQFVEANEMRKNKNKTISSEDNVPRMRVRLMRGSEVIVDCDARTPTEHRRLIQKVKSSSPMTEEAINQSKRIKEYEDYQKQMIQAQLYARAPERKYDHSSMTEFMEHGFVESFMYLLDMQDAMDKADPVKRRQRNKINQTEFIRNCMRRGMGIGIPAANARLKLEDKLFRVDDEVDDEEAKGKPRGSYGKDPNGKEDLDMNPMYGYTTYLSDVDSGTIMRIPRKYIKEIYDGYVRFCNVANAKSKSARITPLNADEFMHVLGVESSESEESNIRPTFNNMGQFAAFSKEVLGSDPTMKNFIAESHNNYPREEDDDPNDDIPPLDVLEEHLEEQENGGLKEGE